MGCKALFEEAQAYFSVSKYSSRVEIAIAASVLLNDRWHIVIQVYAERVRAGSFPAESLLRRDNHILSVMHRLYRSGLRLRSQSTVLPFHPIQ